MVLLSLEILESGLLIERNDGFGITRARGLISFSNRFLVSRRRDFGWYRNPTMPAFHQQNQLICHGMHLFGLGRHFLGCARGFFGRRRVLLYAISCSACIRLSAASLGANSRMARSPTSR